LDPTHPSKEIAKKAPSTLLALLGVTCVDMLLQMTLLRARVVAIRALEGPLVGVNALMACKV